MEAVKKEKTHMRQSTKRRISNTIIYIILIIMSIIWICPFIFITLESFKCESQYQTTYILPKQWGWDNYVWLFTYKSVESNALSDFCQWYLNTLLIAVVVAIGQTLFVLAVAYALSRFRFKLRQPLMKLMLILGMFPGFITIIVVYTILKGWGMTSAGAVPGLMLVYIASSGMGYYVSKGFFDTIPKSLDEAARVDGANRAQVFFKIILPLAKPIVIYTILTAFMAPWGDFIFASYVAKFDPMGMNVAAGLQNLMSSLSGVYYTRFCAGGVLVAIPVTVLFMCLQRFYVEGVTGGAVKG